MDLEEKLFQALLDRAFWTGEAHLRIREKGVQMVQNKVLSLSHKLNESERHTQKMCKAK